MTTMGLRPLGSTGLAVSPVGLGAGRIGDPAVPDDAVAGLLHGALDRGVTLIDAARSYGLAEERIGRHLAGRRREFALSTKVGYGIAGVPDWTGEAVARGIDEALRRLRTDVLDLVHLHSCPRQTLERGEVVAALERAVAAGKVRVAAYSGEGEALAWAVTSGRFGSVQCSASPLDQASLVEILPAACAAGVGVLAKRPLANAPWRFAAEPDEPDVAIYWRRWRALAADLGPLDGLGWDELSLRWAAHHAGADAILLGTTSLAHLDAALAAVARGPLPDALATRVRAAFVILGQGWEGVI